MTELIFLAGKNSRKRFQFRSTLEQTFQKVFGHKINLIGASRTDTGVHALNQVAMFNTDLMIWILI